MNGSIIRDGFELPYIIEGTGLPLLIIGDTPYYQRVFSQSLRMNFQMIFAINKGFIKPVDEANHANHSVYELQALVEDIEALRQQLGIDKFFVLIILIHCFYLKKVTLIWI